MRLLIIRLLFTDLWEIFKAQNTYIKYIIKHIIARNEFLFRFHFFHLLAKDVSSIFSVRVSLGCLIRLFTTMAIHISRNVVIVIFI